MLLVFDFLLLQVDFLLVLVQYHRDHNLMPFQVADDLPEMAAHERPFLFTRQLLPDLRFVAEDDHLRLALDLL